MLLSGDMSWSQIALCWGAIIVIATIYVVIKGMIGKKKAETGEDRQTVWGILQKTVPDVENYTRAYASWEWSTRQGRRTTTSYWYYGIAFNDERLYVVPLSCEGGDISYTEGFVIEKDSLGIVNTIKGTNWVELYDKNRAEIISLMVEGENLNYDKFQPVNIIQEEEAKTFAEWKDKWMDEVNDANGVTVTGMKKRPLENGQVLTRE